MNFDHRRPPGRVSGLSALAIALAALGVLTAPVAAPAQGQVNRAPKVTWHWHQHQPIYWNDKTRSSADDRYETAWESIQQKDGGNAHPSNNLREIFGKDDRVAAYQWRMRDSLGSIGSHLNSGVTVTYSGALMENIKSLGNANQLGYSGGWKNPILEAINWRTTGGARRMDITNFTHHHSLTGLQDPVTIAMEIRLNQEMQMQTLGLSMNDLSDGFFPTELTFSTRLIPTLLDAGIEWTYVSGEKIARAMPDFPLVLGSGGVMCAPPNRADKLNPPGVNFLRYSIDRGCSPVNANPASYQPAYVQWVDPNSPLGNPTVRKMVAVPIDQAWSWNDGYRCIGSSFLDDINSRNNTNQPSLVVLGHDGDNAFGGGFSYYLECVPNLANDARNKGYEVTVVEQYLSQFPPSTSNVIHVEDGGWVNADSDFGSPTFINWNYPLLSSTGQVDPVNGWHEKIRDMAIFTATLNRVLTAQQITGHTPNFAKILNPDGSTAAVDKAWHYFLGSLDSGNVYFGPAEDLEVKATLGCNEANQRIDSILSNLSNDLTPPSILLPQRFPYNPGGENYGVEFGYRRVVDDGDFHIYTFAADASGVASSTLKYRIDTDGANPLTSHVNELYADGSSTGEVGAWQSLAMTKRVFPKGLPAGYTNGAINFFELPTHIADHFSVPVNGLRDVLIDYYVESVDTRGNVSRSPIQHVYIGDGSGSGGGDTTVTIAPNPPVRGESATITYNATGRPLDAAANVYIHRGQNGWQNVVTPDPQMVPTGTPKQFTHTFTVPDTATVVNAVFNNGTGTWDNNSGQDWAFNTIEGSDNPPTAAFGASPTNGVAPLAVQFTDASTNSPTAWEWDFDNNGTVDSTEQNPQFTYTTAGFKTVKLVASNTFGSDEEVKTNFINVGAPPTDPSISLNKAQITASSIVGSDATADSFTVRNSGVGTLNYTVATSTAGRRGLNPTPAQIARMVLGLDPADMAADLNNDGVVDMADAIYDGPAPSWLIATPTSGSSTGEEDTIAVQFDSDALAPGTYNGTITVAGNAPNSPRTIAVTLNVAENIPATTTVVPNPPIAGQGARVWYQQAGGPLASFGAINLHWGINGGLAAGGTWQGVTTTPMTKSGTTTMWYADITIPANATSLNFVTNNAGTTWDNNAGADWNFAVTGGAPGIVLSTTTLTATAVQGSSPSSQSFTVRNSGGGTLSYTLTKASTGSGTDWFAVAPGSGTSTGEADTVTVTYNTTALAQGSYSARIDVAGNAANSPQSVDVNLTITASIPNTTTVVPNPPNAGEAARVWYQQAGGPLAAFSAINLHWGINGGPTGGSAWSNVTSTPMTKSGSTTMWFADITIPANATSLNFVTNNAGTTWDNNSNNNWNFAVNSGDAAIELSTSSITATAAEGATPSTQTFTVRNAGEGVLNWSASFTPDPLRAARGTGGGTRKTIAIDGVNTAGEWTDNEIVASDPAFDNANVSGGNWSTHETQFDYTQLYSAWDDQFLYVAFQIADVIDVEDPANAGSSQGTRPHQMNLIQYIAIDTKDGGYGSDPATGDMWGKGHGFLGDNRPDYQVYFASNFWQGPFLCPYDNGWDPDNDTTGPSPTGLRGASANHWAGGDIIGPGGKDYVATTSHNEGRSSFFEVRIPLALIGSPDLDTDGIGIWVSHGEGDLFSGVDSIPNDPATTNTPGVSQSNSPNEWEDFDNYSEPFAAVGNGGINGGGGSWLTLTPTAGTSTGETDSVTVSFDTTGLLAGSYAGTVTVTGNAPNSPRTIPVTLTITGGGTPNPQTQLSTSSVNASAQQGATPANSTFTVRNSGTGTLNYTLTKQNTGDGVAWFTVSPTSGTSTGEADTITVSYNTTGLAPDTYAAAVEVAGGNSGPQMLSVFLTVTSAPTQPTIVIGPGPSLGTNVEGTSYNQEFQDWTAADVRGLDTNDAAALGDGYDGSRDISAFYSRFQGDNLMLRVDLLELGIFAENGNVDVYVLIDCAAGGTSSYPNGISGTLPDRQWDIAVATYDATNSAIIRSNGTTIANAHLGSYWRSDLDSVEFGVKKSALTTAGWDGTSPVWFWVFTGKDLTTTKRDEIGGWMSSANTNPGRGKFAIVAHGNQSLNRGDSMRDRIYKPAAQTGTGAPSGFRLTLDTHTIYNIPLNVHMSGTLISAIGWIKDADPKWDGQNFLNIVGDIVDANQVTHPGAKVGGVWSEHIMPYFNGPINAASITHFDELTEAVWGITGDEMDVMHIPERVTNSKASPARDPFDDIVDSEYRATYIDEVAHIRNWLYPSDPWTGIGGAYGEARQHKIHLINGVYTFQINDNEDQYKFWPQDGGANMNWRLNLLYKALDTDQAQVTLIFDDWEAMAGYSFGSGYNDNALNYNTVMRWVANKPWIEVVTLKEVLDRATNAANPQYNAGWVVNQGDIGNKPFDTYDYLHHATQDSYDNWYWGQTGLEESFRNAVPTVSGNVGSGTAMPSGKVFGDIATPGTIIYDTWATVSAAPQNNLRRLAEIAYASMIYETAWHDEDNTNYDRNPGTNYKTWLFPDTTYDRVSGWLFTLANHLRTVSATTAAANWSNSIKTGTRPAGVTVSSTDIDQDGQNEFVLANERVWLAFEARGGRCTQAYFYDPVLQDSFSFLGTSPINNPTGQGEEEGIANASRCSAFKDTAGGTYADAIYNASTGASSITFTSPNGLISKTISLTGGSNTVSVAYTNNTGADLYVRMGVSVNNLDLLKFGQNFVSSYSATTFSQTNSTEGAVTIQAVTNSGISQLDAFTRFVIPLTEQMEVRVGTGSSTFTVTPN
ncbi:MAG: carbohydrate-binding protein [Candidatus Sumerlaeia bacterium]|nr:carbohydrate-binding protein [Candidatus Sumerlaeia bacterium]